MSVSRELSTLRVLGVDPGSEITGYGVIDSDGRRDFLVEFGTISFDARRTALADRLLRIGEKLEEVTGRLKPHVCAVEGTFFAVNVKSALSLGQVKGAVLVAAARSGLPVFEYSPLEIKSAVVGYGRAEKSQVQEMVRIILGLAECPSPLDASDALAVAICHAHTASTTHARAVSRTKSAVRSRPVNNER